jgi:hypothetical protein
MANLCQHNNDSPEENSCKPHDKPLATLRKHNKDIPTETLCKLNNDNPVVTLCKHNDNPMANLYKHNNDIPVANLYKLNEDTPSSIHYGNFGNLIEYQRLMKNSAPSI